MLSFFIKIMLEADIVSRPGFISNKFENVMFTIYPVPTAFIYFCAKKIHMTFLRLQVKKSTQERGPGVLTPLVRQPFKLPQGSTSGKGRKLYSISIQMGNHFYPNSFLGQHMREAPPA